MWNMICVYTVYVLKLYIKQRSQSADILVLMLIFLVCRNWLSILQFKNKNKNTVEQTWLDKKCGKWKCEADNWQRSFAGEHWK